MNKKLIIQYLFFFVLFANCDLLFGQFSEKDQSDIRKKAIKLLIEYENKIDVLGKEVKSIDKTRINIEAFMRLFVNNRIQVYNDLDPAHLMSEYYEAETYSSNLALWYPDGITVMLNLDYAQVSNIISQGEDVYTIDFIVEKQIRGQYLGKTPNNNTELLLFRIGFASSGGQFKNFRIAGIRKSIEKDYLGDLDKIKEIKGAQLNSDEKRDIDRETRTLLNDYTNYLSLIGDTAENIEEKIMYKKSFRSLFSSNQSLVYNDILPDSRNQFVPVSDYINLYSEAYASDGGIVTFKLDSADLGIIVSLNDTLFYRLVQIGKSFIGNYLGKRKVSFVNRIALRINFVYSSSVFKNFRIERIDPIVAKKQEVIAPRTYSDLIKHKPGAKKSMGTDYAKHPEKRDFLFDESNKVRLGLGFLAGQGKISNGNINDLNYGNVGYEWITKSKCFYSFYGRYIYMLGPKFGLVTGIGYSSTGTSYSLNSNDSFFTVKIAYKDVNDTPYYKIVKAAYDSIVSISTINIPIECNFVLDAGKNIQFIIRPGLNVGLISKATSQVNAQINYYKVYYTQKTFPIFQYRDWPELNYNFYNYSAKDKNRDIKSMINTVYLSLDASAGMEIYLGDKISLALMGSFQYGLTDLIKSKKDYIEIFSMKSDSPIIQNSQTFIHKPTRIFTYGLAIEFTVKL